MAKNKEIMSNVSDEDLRQEATTYDPIQSIKDRQFVEDAYKLFKEFYERTQPFRDKCKENDEYWKANHWFNKKVSPQEPQPVTPILFSTIESMLADIMDNFPTAVILPVEPGDEAVAKDLSDIVPSILQRRNFKETFRKNKRSMLKKGASVTEVMWDKDLYNGLGDINVINWDIRNFLWDVKCEDIQEGRACFKFAWHTLSWFKQHYPDKYQYIKKDEFTRDGYDVDGVLVDSNDDEYLLMEYWYKKYNPETGSVSVHMAKLAGRTILERSEDTSPDGIYEHGKYPFIIDAPYQFEDQPVGLGVIDIFKSLQDHIDKLDQIILKNALMSGKMRLLISRTSGLDKNEVLDWGNEILEGDRVDANAVRWFQAAPLNQYILQHFNEKISAIKEESGQNQFTRGEGGKSVTAASAIIALQEAGNKRTRMVIESVYDGFSRMVMMVIDLIKEFYTETRRFRIAGAADTEDHVTEINSDMLRYETNPDTGEPMTDEEGNILEKYTEFDVKVSAQVQSPYKSMYQNDLAIQLRQLGVTNEIETLELMDFEGKDKIISMVKKRVARDEELAMQMQQMQMGAAVQPPQPAEAEAPAQAIPAEMPAQPVPPEQPITAEQIPPEIAAMLQQGGMLQ